MRTVGGDSSDENGPKRFSKKGGSGKKPGQDRNMGCVVMRTNMNFARNIYMYIVQR